MLYAILAYHAGGVVEAFTPDEDAALMGDLLAIHGRMVKDGLMGPAGRLSGTAEAVTLRGLGPGMVIDGPFAETKEHLLGFYVVDCASRDEAVAAAREMKRVNTTAVYEIRPVSFYLPGAKIASE